MKKETGINLKKFRQWLLKNVGKKCEKYDIGCYVCVVWRIYDDLELLLKDNKL